MSNKISKAYSEVYEILQLLDNEFISKLPKKFIEFIENEKDNEYTININPNIPLEEQDLLEDTVNILAMLKLDYWSTEDEKQELLSILNQNEKEYQAELHEKYNPDNIFKNKSSIQSEQISLVPIKEKNFILKLFEKLKNMFQKNEKCKIKLMK